jgi:membrane fusion protein (multidrug efflux system)
VIQVAQRAHVFRLKDDGSVEQVYVTLGQRRRGEVEVVDGLSAGDRIVVDGVVKLRDGARVTEAAPPAAAATEEKAA